MQHALTPTERVLAALAARGSEGMRSANGWLCQCPAHDDHDPSLKIDTGEDGRVLLHCHAGCTIEAVCGALGIGLADLMPDGTRASSPERANGRRGSANRNGQGRKGGDLRSSPSARAGGEAEGGLAGAKKGARTGATFATAEEASRAYERSLGPTSARLWYADACRGICFFGGGSAVGIPGR